MPAFRRVEPHQAGARALGILVPPGPKTVVILRPRGLDWDLLPRAGRGSPRCRRHSFNSTARKRIRWRGVYKSPWNMPSPRRKIQWKPSAIRRRGNFKSGCIRVSLSGSYAAACRVSPISHSCSPLASKPKALREACNPFSFRRRMPIKSFTSTRGILPHKKQGADAPARLTFGAQSAIYADTRDARVCAVRRQDAGAAGASQSPRG